MSMRKLTSLIQVVLIMAAATCVPSTAIPRKSPDFTINESSGKQVLLSSFKGKVVMIEFFFLRSQKCLNLAETMNKLNAQLGRRGFQPIAVAFPAPQSDANGPLVGYLAEAYKLTYPVGYADKNSVDQYLQRAPDEILRIPQVILIDRAGMIRAQSGGRDGNLRLEDENYLHALVESLLNENTSANAPARQPQAANTEKPSL